MKTSASCIASAKVRLSVSAAMPNLNGLRSATEVDHPLAVDREDVAAVRTHVISRRTAAMPAAPAPSNTMRAVLELLALQFQRIEQTGGDDDRGAVLIVVEHRDVQLLDQDLLDLETVRARRCLRD
jgi:hypothetical protein